MFSPKTTAVFSKHVSREGKSEFLKPYYCKQHVRTSISMIYLKLLNDGKILAAVQSIFKSQWWVTHTLVTLVNFSEM
jgi:hypothetical protein